MNIETTQTRGGQNGRRQDQAIGGDNRDIGIERGKFPLNILIAQADGVAHLDPKAFRLQMHRGGGKLLATARTARRLAIYGGNLVPGIHQCYKGWNRKIGSAHKNDPHVSPETLGKRKCKPLLHDLMSSPEIDALTQALARLPGLGPRSARRAVLHLIKRRETGLLPLLRALEGVADNLSTCQTCGNVDTRNPCGICNDPRRDSRQLCVVEDVPDLWALERSRLFPGRFHVLGGRLSALEGVRPEDLTIDALVARVANGGIDEVVLAMNATLEGQTTAHYLAERLERFPVRLSQLAHGLPVGGELDYLDEGTLAQALRARRPMA